MERLKSLLRWVTFVMLTCMTTLWVTQANAADFCWKDSEGRGAGTIPTQCPAGRTNIAGLCYTSCKAGYTMGAFGICSQACPPGYSSSGVATCHIDKPLTRDGNWECTERDWFGTCWWSVLRCPAGYTNAGLFCALTTPSRPAGYSGTSLDPIRSTYTQDLNDPGRIPQGCSGGKTNQNGLCYSACPAGMTGVGPVCWGNPPKSWVGCGMGAASSSAKCAEQVFDQVTSVGILAADIATLGSAGAAGSAAKLSKLEKLKAAYQAAKKANPKYAENAKKLADAYDAVDATRTRMSVLDSATGGEKMTDEELASMAAAILSLSPVPPLMGSTAGVVSSYTAPVCSKLNIK
jgi:hypothetical protein